jgi:hypothetical protein
VVQLYAPAVGITAAKVKVKVILQSTVGQSVLMSGTHLGPMTKSLFSSDSCSLMMWGILSDENGYVVYSGYWASQLSLSEVQVP